MNTLKKQLDLLESHILNQALLNPEISASNIGWHIEHLLLSMNMIVEQVKNSNPENYKWRFNFAKMVIFTLKNIPRGRAKTPEQVAPKTYDEASLKAHMKIARSNYEDLKNQDSNKFFTHPFFGDLRLKKTITFLEIHNKHHLKIIDDILKSQ